MSKLADILLTSPKHEQFVEQCAEMVDKHFAGLRGLKGIGLKTGINMLKASRPRAMPEAVERLLPGIVKALEPEYTAWNRTTKQHGFDEYLLKHHQKTLDAIMSVVDERVGNSQHPTMRSMFGQLRGGIQSEVDKMLPNLARLLGKFAQ